VTAALRAGGSFRALVADAAGHVDMDALTERARHNYLYARTVVGREFATPAVQPSRQLQ
jgi:hypothetical protein